MKKFIKRCFTKVKSCLVTGKLAIAAGASTVIGSIVSSPKAQAAIDLTGVSVDTSDYITIATFLITALVAFWGIKKGLALLGR